jgi:DNA-binding transcriptional LysR family regulator
MSWPGTARTDVSMVSAGLGIVQVLKYMAEHEVTRGRLVEILPRYRPATIHVGVIPAS